MVWKNQLRLRNRLTEHGGMRQVELFVAPRGEIRYTLDGSEPRNGTPYNGPLSISDSEVLVRAFAASEGLEVKSDFTVPAKGEQGVQIEDTKSALLISRTGYKLDSRASTFEGLKQASDISVTFENVTLTVGQGTEIARFMVGEVKTDAVFLRQLLEKVLEQFSPNTPVTMTFQRAHFSSGHDLKQLCANLGLEVAQGTVEQ